MGGKSNLGSEFKETFAKLPEEFEKTLGIKKDDRIYYLKRVKAGFNSEPFVYLAISRLDKGKEVFVTWYEADRGLEVTNEIIRNDRSIVECFL